MSLVYILTNESMPGLIKVGFTKRKISQRVHELSSHTGVPTPFRPFKYWVVDDPRYVESKIHRLLGKFRVSTGREFFQISPEIAAQILIDSVDEIRAAENQKIKAEQNAKRQEYLTRISMAQSQAQELKAIIAPYKQPDFLRKTKRVAIYQGLSLLLVFLFVLFIGLSIFLVSLKDGLSQFSIEVSIALLLFIIFEWCLFRSIKKAWRIVKNPISPYADHLSEAEQILDTLNKKINSYTKQIQGRP